MNPTCLIYQPHFVTPLERQQMLHYVGDLQPLFEERYSRSNPPPDGKAQRSLLRPVYWLGNWQFACLDYYRPPKGLFNRCVRAEPFPEFMQKIIARIETQIRLQVPEKDVPKSWTLNTCLINFYGDRVLDGKKEDVARVGEHKDFEPGPVASVSFGERALFQFVESRNPQAKSQVVLQQWLEDRSLQVFAGDKYKKKLFHRVQRVESKLKNEFSFKTQDFVTRRLNLTFRYVPEEHVIDFQKLPEKLQLDILPYVEVLSRGSEFWHQAMQRN